MRDNQGPKILLENKAFITLEFRSIK